MKYSLVKNLLLITAALSRARGTGMRPVHREAVAWASRTLRVGVGWGPDRGFPAHGPGSIPRRVDDCRPCLSVEGPPGAAQLSRNDSGGKGGRLLSTLTSHPLIRAAECLNGPFPV